MKTSFLNLFSCLLLCSTFLFTSCGEDDTLDPATAEAAMTCKIDGGEWIAVTPTASIINNTFNVTGVSSDDLLITVTVSGDTEGSYSLDPNLANVIAHTETSDGSTFAFASNQNEVNTNFGSVIISRIDTTNKTVSGTFSTEAHRLIDGTVRIITEGSFTNIPYTETVAPTTSKLSATVDGTVFEAVSVSGFVAFGNLSINGTDATANETIGLTIPEDITAGTYELGTAGFSDYGAQYNADSDTFLPADSGTLIITEHRIADKVIKGTFSFEASDFGDTVMASITGGSFELTY